MINFDNIKSKVITAVGVAADTTKDIADKASDKARDVSRIAKLTFEIGSEKDVIKKAYSEIGKLYYDTYKENPEGFFIQLCDEVTLAMENIAAKEAEIATLKESSSIDDDSITVEFEEIVDEDIEEVDISDMDDDMSDISADDFEADDCDCACSCHDDGDCDCAEGECKCTDGECCCEDK